KRALARVESDMRHIFRLDERLEEFYASIGDDPEFSWIARDGAGRLLRSPTVFEDLVKSITTTNCSWSLTRKMVTELVNNLGRERVADGQAQARDEAREGRRRLRGGEPSEARRTLRRARARLLGARQVREGARARARVRRQKNRALLLALPRVARPRALVRHDARL